jgi:predicted transcriptional regulator
MSGFTKRGSFRIIHEILSVCAVPSKKTRIVYGCNLNFGMLQKYLEYLVDAGLVSFLKGEGKEHYVTTEKGKAFIESYCSLTGLLEDKEKERSILLSQNNSLLPPNPSTWSMELMFDKEKR